MSDDYDFEYMTRSAPTVEARQAPDVVLVPGFLGREEADALLDRIHLEVNFQQNYYKMGKKTGPRPRLEAWYSPWDYTFGGKMLPAQPMLGFLQVVIDRIRDAGYGDYNAVLINKYRNGKDYVDWHSDDDYAGPEPTIPSLTLGAARPFKLRLRADHSVKAKPYLLPGHGDLLVMRGRTNAEWQHQVPKTAKRIAERINLTFRMRQAHKAPTKQESKPPSKGGAEAS